MAGIQNLAYVVAQCTDPARWKTYARETLGAMAHDAPDGGVHVKTDERSFRIQVVKGGEDRYIASGWEVASEADFNDALATLRKNGITVEAGSEALRAARQVRDLASFKDPSGNLHEISHGYRGGSTPFVSPIGVGGFKTGPQGMGHTVLPALEFDATLKLFRALGFGISDEFVFQPGPDAPKMRIWFLHAASGRHHSLALAEMPNPAGCVHIMLEVNDKADVDRADQRREKQGVKLMATMGQHENDKMTSFYMMTPSGFALEYGWGGIDVDPASWKTTQTTQVSIWGHDFSVGFR